MVCNYPNWNQELVLDENKMYALKISICFVQFEFMGFKIIFMACLQLVFHSYFVSVVLFLRFDEMLLYKMSGEALFIFCSFSHQRVPRGSVLLWIFILYKYKDVRANFKICVYSSSWFVVTFIEIKNTTLCICSMKPVRNVWKSSTTFLLSQ